MARKRIFLVGVGGQGTLTATKMLGQIALDAKIPVITGEIHGMAQRGGIVESTVLLGGYKSPRIGVGQADLLLGFEPMETLRALCMLRKDGMVVCNTDPIPPGSVSSGRDVYPEWDRIREKVESVASRTVFLPCLQLARQAGSAKAANTVLLAAACAAADMGFGLDDLKNTVSRSLKPHLVDMNMKAIDLGAQAATA